MNAVDTNVLIYRCDRRDMRRQQIATDLIGGLTDGVLLWQVACEFIAASRKLTEQGFTQELAWAHLGDFLDSFALILPSRAVLDRARTLHLDQQWSYWDALLVGACLEAGVKRLFSQDVPGRRPPGDLEIIDPFA